MSVPRTSDSTSKTPLLPMIMTILVAVIWSTGGAGVRLVDHLAPWDILFWRALFMVIATFTWLAVDMARKHTGFRTLGSKLLHGLPVSLCFSASLILYIMSIKHTTVADSLLIQGTGPLFIILFGRVLLKDPLGRSAKIAVTGIITGLLVIFLPALTTSRLQGNVYGIGKAVMFGASTLFIRKLKEVDLVPTIALTGVIVCTVSGFSAGTFILPVRDLAVLGYLGMFQTGIAFMLYAIWSKQVPSTYTGIIVTLEAVLGPLWAWLIIGEVPAVYTLIGGAIIIAALIFNSVTVTQPEGT